MAQKKVILIIMDGWGLGKVASADAIQHSQAPFVKSLYLNYPNSTLVTCGEQVGLPDGQMGNSEVGHLNLGAGRIVYQELQRINVAILDGSFAKNEVLLKAIARSEGTRASVVAQFFKTKISNGILGSFSFDRNGDTTAPAVTIYRIFHGKPTVFRVIRPRALIGG